MNEKELIEETVGGSIKQIKKELVHILVNDEEIKSLVISECDDVINERFEEELKKIKTKIENVDLRFKSALDIKNNILIILDNRITELKGK